MRTTVQHILASSDHVRGTRVMLEGWVRSNRTSKTMTFLDINDGSHLHNLQVTCAPTLPDYDAVCKLTVGSAVRIHGTLQAAPHNATVLECVADTIEIVSRAPSDYPLQKKRHSFEYLRTQAHLRPRTNTFSAVFRLRSVMSFAVHRFFQERGFHYLTAPILTASDAEGAGEMFQVLAETESGAPFFGEPAHLSVSGQLNAEAYALAFHDVYTFGPTFRAEDSNTARHASEFWMVEPEIAFADLNDDIALAEEFMRFLIRTALTELPAEMAFFDERIEPGCIARLEAVLRAPFVRMTYTDAVEQLLASNATFTYPVHWGMDLQTEHERYLTDDIIHGPVFVTDYPKDIKAFYMRLNDDDRTVAAVDLLVPGIGEIIGGSQREDREDVLLTRMAALNMSPQSYDWYVALRRYGGTPHAGFGLGFERLLMYLSGMKNIRDVIPFPRVPGQIGF